MAVPVESPPTVEFAEPPPPTTPSSPPPYVSDDDGDELPMQINKTRLRQHLRKRGFTQKEATAEIEWRSNSQYPSYFLHLYSPKPLFLLVVNPPRSLEEFRAQTSEAIVVNARPVVVPREIVVASSSATLPPVSSVTYFLLISFSFLF